MYKREVDRIRDRTPIGAKVDFVMRQAIDDQPQILGHGKIETKYRDVFTVRDTRGRLRCFQWKELLMMTAFRQVMLRG